LRHRWFAVAARHEQCHTTQQQTNNNRAFHNFVQRIQEFNWDGDRSSEWNCLVLQLLLIPVISVHVAVSWSGDTIKGNGVDR
jgi:hypothetical protein